MKNKAQLINQTSNYTEYYTDIKIISAVRQVMPVIDLDPASSARANDTIGARQFIHSSKIFDEKTGNLIKINGGLEHPWSGNVWMNHPFSRPEAPCGWNCTKKICIDRGYHTDIHIPGNPHWINKLVRGYADGAIEHACCITYVNTSETWFWPLMDYPICYLRPRTNYWLPDGTLKKGATKGSCVTYLGSNVQKFCEVFDMLGRVMLPYNRGR